MVEILWQWLEIDDNTSRMNVGMELKQTTEEYTSKTCPLCLQITKPKDRIFICSECGHFVDRDILGARNIYSKSKFGSIQSELWNEAVPCGVSA